jgi:hypothetical protein
MDDFEYCQDRGKVRSLENPALAATQNPSLTDGGLSAHEVRIR